MTGICVKRTNRKRRLRFFVEKKYLTQTWRHKCNSCVGACLSHRMWHTEANHIPHCDDYSIVGHNHLKLVPGNYPKLIPSVLHSSLSDRIWNHWKNEKENGKNQHFRKWLPCARSLQTVLESHEQMWNMTDSIQIFIRLERNETNYYTQSRECRRMPSVGSTIN